MFNYRIVDYNFEYRNLERQKSEKTVTIISVIIFIIGLILAFVFKTSIIAYAALYLFSYRYIIRSKEMKEQKHKKADTVYWSGFLLCSIFLLLSILDLFLTIIL